MHGLSAHPDFYQTGRRNYDDFTERKAGIDTEAVRVQKAAFAVLWHATCMDTSELAAAIGVPVLRVSAALSRRPSTFKRESRRRVGGKTCELVYWYLNPTFHGYASTREGHPPPPFLEDA